MRDGQVLKAASVPGVSVGWRSRRAGTVARPARANDVPPQSSGPSTPIHRSTGMDIRMPQPPARPGPLRPTLRARRLRRVVRGRHARPPQPPHGGARPGVAVQPRPPGRHQRRAERGRRRRDPHPGARPVPARGRRLRAAGRRLPTPSAWPSCPATPRPRPPPWTRSRRSPPPRASRCSAGARCRSTTR